MEGSSRTGPESTKENGVGYLLKSEQIVSWLDK